MTKCSSCFRLQPRPLFISILIAAGLSVSARGQQAPKNGMAAQGLQMPAAPGASAQLPAFDVSTVKPAKSDGMSWGWRYTPDGVSLNGMPMLSILCAAFDVEDERIVGLPNSMTSQRYDIEAKVDPADAPRLKGLNFHQRYAMLVPVLVDRFNLKFHHETRVMPVFDLVVAKGGPKLAEAKPGPDGKAKDGGWSEGNGRMTATSTTIESLTSCLTNEVRHPVLDKTGLTGHYDFKLRWTPEDAPVAPGVDGDADTSAPDLFTALQEQLGLKLESRKEPMDVIVIDHIEKPSEN